MGLNTCRTIPPTWNNGIKLQFTSDGPRSQLNAIVAAAVSISPMLCGTSFLFPVVPDVNSTNTSSACVFGSVENDDVVVFFFFVVAAADVVVVVLFVLPPLDGRNENMPDSPGLGTNPMKGTPSLSAHCSTFLNTDQSRPPPPLLSSDVDVTLNLSSSSVAAAAAAGAAVVAI